MLKWRDRKRSFLLLEVILALSLVALCSIPLIRPQLLYVRKHIEALRFLELELESEKALSEIKQSLYLQTLDWKTIVSSEKKTVCIDQKRISPNCDRKIYLSCLLQPGREDTTWGKLKITVVFSHGKHRKKLRVFHHTLCICGKNRALEIKLNSV